MSNVYNFEPKLENYVVRYQIDGVTRIHRLQSTNETLATLTARRDLPGAICFKAKKCINKNNTSK